MCSPATLNLPSPGQMQTEITNSPGLLAPSHTRMMPRLLPVHSSPQGVVHMAVTCPILWACHLFSRRPAK